VSALLPPQEFNCPAATGAIYHHGAHIVAWTPAGQEPVLWLSRETKLDSQVPIRGGVPICWPWFGFGRGGQMSPQHGFARLVEWRLLKATTDGQNALAKYLLVSRGTPDFDYPYRLTYDVTFGRELTAALTVRNTGTQPFSFEEALHTYLRVGDSRQISIVGLDQATYSDRSAGADPASQTQVSDVMVTRELSRVYLTTNRLEVLDPVLKRRLVMTRQNSANVVVWNPWVAKAKAMDDFGDDEWQTMVCAETANVEDQAIELEPGEEHTMGFTLAVEPL